MIRQITELELVGKEREPDEQENRLVRITHSCAAWAANAPIPCPVGSR